MRLIFLGDIAVAQTSNMTRCLSSLNDVTSVIANLEGPLTSDVKAKELEKSRSPILYNSMDVFKILDFFKVRAVSLANNHICDGCLSLTYTKELLSKAGVASFGAGNNLLEAKKPLVLSQNDTAVKIFAFGWHVIGCQTATRTRQGVNPFTPQHALNTIRLVRATDDSSTVIFLIHWNYELSLYPQPAHRQLAQDLIREGVDAVIGLHPHVAQGAELFEGKPIVYSLGNWFFPERKLGHFQLAYPPITSRQLALELEIEERRIKDVRFHWHQFDTNRNLICFEKTEHWDGAILQKLTPYADISHPEYTVWFKEHRTRRRGLPVYVDYRHSRRNWVKNRWVRARQGLIKVLVSTRLKRSLRD